MKTTTIEERDEEGETEEQYKSLETGPARKAASVKIVLVHSSKNGERSTRIRKLANHLEEILPSIEDYGTNFTHFFTKYSSNPEDQEAIINELKSTHCGSESKEFWDIISTMKRTVCLFIDPLHPNLRVDIVKELANKENMIRDPEEVFLFKASGSDSMLILENKLLDQQREIILTFSDSKPDYALIKYRLDELKFFVDITQKASTFSAKYHMCVEELKKQMAAICHRIIVVFDERFLKEGVLEEEEIRECEYMQQIEGSMRTHLKDGLIPTHEINMHFPNLDEKILEELCNGPYEEILTWITELNRLKEYHIYLRHFSALSTRLHNFQESN